MVRARHLLVLAGGTYTRRALQASRAIRAAAWALVVGGVAAPVLRKRLALPRVAVMATAAASPAALAVAAPRGRARDVAVVCLNMWAYVAAYELPHDDADAQEARVHIDYPLDIDRFLGMGTPPTVRLQNRWAHPRTSFSPFEKLLVASHWVWFAVPHCTVAYVLWRRPERFASAAARMYGVFDLGAVFYWAIPTAPPWYAAQTGRMRDSDHERVRRMMIEYGEEFWGDRWAALYDLLAGNPLAAMPSLHFATSLMAAHLLSEVGPVSGAVGWAYATTLGVALVYLGEHYAADLLGGALLTETVRSQAPRLSPLARRLVAGLEALRGEPGTG
jgi:membrane-associated phospholipid phosphatase